MEIHARALLGALTLAGVGGAAGRMLWLTLARLPRGVLNPPYRLLSRHRQWLTPLAPACPLPDTSDPRLLP
ncbi:MAG: hypothetical protein OEW11_02320 [Nitrospirota bacterium]|nr:hypothetical protein [Nitrospirota bacterium]